MSPPSQRQALSPALQRRVDGARLVPLRILVTLGWSLMAGQVAAVLMLFFRSGLHPKLAISLAIVAVFSLINASVGRYWRQKHEGRGWITDREASRLLALLMMQLTVFFVFSGGILNPFVILLLAPITVSATALPRRLTSALVILAILLLAILTLAYVDLPWRNRTGAISALILPLDYRAATWTALVITIVFLSLFISWQADLARRTARALERTRHALDQERTLTHVGGLAAAAAHELGTPLATIAITAQEMADILTDSRADPSLIEDAQLLVEETTRCRNIIAELAKPNGEVTHGHESFLRVDLGEILDRIVEKYNRPGISFTAQKNGTKQIPEPHPSQQPELIQGLGNIIQNAFQFAHSQVIAKIEWNEEYLKLIILDDGPGYQAGVLDRLGQPYNKGTDSDRPSMGLGLFIATSLLRNTGAKTEFRNRRDGQTGAQVSLTWNLPI